MFRGLTEDDVARRDVVRRTVDRWFAPLQTEIDRSDEVDPVTLRALRKHSAEAGSLGFNLPEHLGGGGLGYLGQAVIGVEMGRVTTVLCEQVGHLPDSLRYVDDAQRRWLLDPLLSGEHSISYALTEPGGGSDLGSARTRAQRTGDGWSITGAKQFISNAGVAEHVLVLAVTDPDAPMRGRFTVFVVPAGTPGFHVLGRHRTMGWHGHHLNALSFESCVVPDTHVLGEVGGGFEVIMATINGARLNVASRCVGAAELALHEAATFAAERPIGTVRLADLGMTQQKLADMDLDVATSALLIAEAAAAGDAGEHGFRLAVARAKLASSEAAGRVADAALQILGGAGYTDDHPVERIARDVRGYRIGEGTSEIQRVQIARGVVSRETADVRR